MKKICILITAILGFCGVASAITTNAPMSTISNLAGNKAYTWGISINLASGQQVTSATINWANITLTSPNTGTLYTDLLRSSLKGVKSYNDYDAPGDHFSTLYSSSDRTLLGSKTFTKNITSSLSYALTGAQLIILNSYLLSNAGTFDLGFDPDCTYTTGQLSFTYTLGSTTPPSVPDGAATALLVIVGLAAVELFRRKFAPAH